MRKFTTMLTALSFAVLAAGPSYADETTMVPPKKPAASPAKPKAAHPPAKPKAAHPPANANQSGHCMQEGDHMHKGMKGMNCAGKTGKMKPMGKDKMKPMGKDKMKPMGKDEPSMPMAEHDM